MRPESNPALPVASDASKEPKPSKCDSNSNIMPNAISTATTTTTTTRKRPSSAISSSSSPENHRNIKSKYKNLSPCTVVLTNLTDKPNAKANGISKTVVPSVPNQTTSDKSLPEQPEIIEFSDDDSDAELFEIEESNAPHVPLYHLRDEGSVKWALLSDLCYMLKVKSKDTLLKQVGFGAFFSFRFIVRKLNKIFFVFFFLQKICSTMPPSSGSNKELLRELKMGDFLERATCLQLLCAGEKLNIRSSKVVLVKYNDSVKSLLGVKTVLMKM